MSDVQIPQKRILAIDPTTRGFGFAVLEGSEDLIDWGVKEARNNKNSRCARLIKNLIDQYQPDAIVLENHKEKGSRCSTRIQKLLERILKLIEEKKITAKLYSKSQVKRSFFLIGTPTKYNIALAIGKKFPELAVRVPPYRKPWMSEDYRMSIFDAMALGLTYFYFINKRKGLLSKENPGVNLIHNFHE